MVTKTLLEKHIIAIPHIQHGRPCIKGTRTPVYVVLESLANDMDFKSIKREFAPITTEDIQACILYAAFLADEEEITNSLA